MKRFLKASLAAALLLAPLTGQTVSTGDPEHARLRAIGEKLKCQCTPCGKSVGACDMQSCHYRDQVNARILPLMKAGMDDATIITKLRETFGDIILGAPPAEGFNLVGWAMPFLTIVFGLLAIRYVVTRWRRPKPAAALPAGSFEKYREQIDKELEDLE